MSICQQQPIRQISTSADAPDAIIRDLQNIIEKLNNVIACQSSMASTVSTLTNGSFSAGDGGNGSGGTGSTGASGAGASGAGGVSQPAGGVGGGPGSVFRFQSGVNFQLPDGFTGIAMIDATADITVKMPIPIAGNSIQVVNVNATHVITLNDDLGTTINPPLYATGFTTVRQSEDSANLPSWFTGVMVQYPDGTVHVPANVVFVGAGTGPTVQSPDATYHLLTISDTNTTGGSTFGSMPPF